MSILVQFWQSTTSTTTQKAAVGLPTGLDATGTTTNTTAALSGHGTGGALGRAPSITRPRGKDDVGTTTTTGIHNVLAILVGTARLKRKARIAATFTIGVTATGSWLALRRLRRDGGQGKDKEKQGGKK